MRMIPFAGLALAALALTGPASPASAQPLRAPPGAPTGSYLQQCSKAQLNGQFLSAVCRGAHGAGQSSINVASCAGDIGVDASGALSCAGPGAAPPPPKVYAAPPPAYDAGRADRGDRHHDRPALGEREAYGHATASLFGARGFRGQSVRLDGPAPNLAGYGLNDRVRSIALEPGSQPWIVCSDADYRGRCITVDHSISDTRQIGMEGVISSLRPLH